MMMMMNIRVRQIDRLMLWSFIIVIINVKFILASPSSVPSFDRTNENITVIIGNMAVLPCFVNNLGDHKVAWIKVSNTDVLVIGDYRVTNDDRIKLTHGYVADWSLSIQPVNEEDAGEYLCQINTEPQLIKKINLQVLLPPKINEEKSTISPEPVKEGDTLTLYCHTEGIPAPKVSWYFRKKSSPHAHQNENKLIHHHTNSNNPGQPIQEGDTLVIKNVTRYYSGVFECIANNSVLPAASRKIKVSVEFAPEVRLVSESVDQYVGHDARFECKIKANPLLNHYWMRDGKVIENGLANLFEGAHFKPQHDLEVKTSAKYEIVTYNQNNHEHLIISALIIRNVTKNDFGVYECFAINTHNVTKAQVELKELIQKKSSTPKSSISRILIFNNDNHNHHNQNNNHNSNNKENNVVDLKTLNDVKSDGGKAESSKIDANQSNKGSTKQTIQSKKLRNNNNGNNGGGSENASGTGSGRNTSKLDKFINGNTIDDDYYEQEANENSLTLKNEANKRIQKPSVWLICFYLIYKINNFINS